MRTHITSTGEGYYMTGLPCPSAENTAIITLCDVLPKLFNSRSRRSACLVSNDIYVSNSSAVESYSLSGDIAAHRRNSTLPGA